MNKCQHNQLILKLSGYICKDCRTIVFDINEIAAKEWLRNDIRNYTINEKSKNL